MLIFNERRASYNSLYVGDVLSRLLRASSSTVPSAPVDIALLTVLFSPLFRSYFYQGVNQMLLIIIS